MELHELPNKEIFFAKGNCFSTQKNQKYGMHIRRLHKIFFFSNTNQPLLYDSNLTNLNIFFLNNGKKNS
jgi:hypothetical protein